jgi:hypothetical protein
MRSGFSANSGRSRRVNPAGGGVVTRYPDGTVPRLPLIWLATETVRTRERRLVLGDSLSTFMRRIGLRVTGGRRGTSGVCGPRSGCSSPPSCVASTTPARGRATASRYDVADAYQLCTGPNNRQGRWRFRKDFEAHLARVLVLYFDARVEPTDSGLVLLPSRPHVSARVRRGLAS